MSVAKIKTNHSARATLRYVICKVGARVIGGDAAPWVERNQLSQDQLQSVVSNATRQLMVSIDLNDRVKRSVGHASIAFPPGEDLDDSQLSEYCEKWLAAMILTSDRPELLKEFDEPEFRAAVEDFRDNELHKYSYSIVRHTDESHPHAHLVYSRINLETERAISTSFERYRSQQILRDLERQYQLTAVPNSWEVGRSAPSISQLQKESETGAVSIQQRLQDLLEQVGQRSATIVEFIENAQIEGVEVRMGFTRTGKSKGISYSLEGVAFSGNALGTRYSFKHSEPGLCKAFDLDYNPERDNSRIQEICQRKPLSQEQRELNTIRTGLAESLSSTAESIQQLDFSAATASRTVDETRTPGRSLERIADPIARSQPPRISAVANGTERIDDHFEPPHLPSRADDRPAIELDRNPASSRLVSGGSSRDHEPLLRAIARQLRDFESNTRAAVQRILQQLSDLNRALEEKRNVQLRPQKRPQQPTESVAVERPFVRLATAGLLSADTWQELTATEQHELVMAAYHQQQSEPKRTTISPASDTVHLAEQSLEHLKREERLAQEELDDLEDTGQRSLRNLFGVGKQVLEESRDQLNTIQRRRAEREATVKDLHQRLEQVDRERTQHREWEQRPETSGAQRILQLRAEQQATERASQTPAQLSTPLVSLPVETVDSERLESAARRILQAVGTQDEKGMPYFQGKYYRLMQRGDGLTIEGLGSDRVPNRMILRNGQLVAGAQTQDVDSLEGAAQTLEAALQAARAKAIAGTVREMWQVKARAGEIRGNLYVIDQSGDAITLMRVNGVQPIAIIPLNPAQPAIGHGLTQTDQQNFAKNEQILRQLQAEAASPVQSSKPKPQERGPRL